MSDDDAVKLPPAAEKPLALFGLNRYDLAGIAFLDRFFSAPPADDHYLLRRQRALLIGLSGAVGPAGAWLPPAEQNCDFELIAGGAGYLALPCSAAGERWLEPYPARPPAVLEELKNRENCAPAKQPEQLQRAARLLAADLVPDSFWEEIASRCILCSGCNLVCPTCNCFGVEDRRRGGEVERSRVWDSCQLDAFMREASGHNPLGSEALRTRRRIHHKLVADPLRWGELGCVACGRCDRACPTGIGIFAVIEEMLQRYADR
jgi:formate hydrogenlyase subunit 6/NADH:ubiquinone oxidoreductase subunit I